MHRAMNLLLAVLFTAAPFVAGFIAALGLRHDMRMLWMALAATVVARVVVTAMLRGRRGRRAVSAIAIAFAAAVAAASIVAVAFGAHGVVGVVAVAVVLAGCATAGAVLGTASQPTNA